MIKGNKIYFKNLLRAIYFVNKEITHNLIKEKIEQGFTQKSF